MSKLETLEEEYLEALEAFHEDPSDENKDAYEEAKAAFSKARTEQRRSEEADPNHPRGNVMVAVDPDEDGE